MKNEILCADTIEITKGGTIMNYKIFEYDEYLKPFAADNKIVQQPRSYALQSIWEEASESTVKYSSYWSVPVVKGIY